MHQIYSCSDENIEVFTTVIPSKVPSPARRRVKSSQHLTKNVVIESDLYPPRPLELLPHRSERRDAGDSRRFGRLQTARPPGAHPSKTPARPGGFLNPEHQICVGLEHMENHWSGSLGFEINSSDKSKRGSLCEGSYGSLMQAQHLLGSQIPPVARISVKAPAVVEAAATGSENGIVLGRGSRHFKKIAEDYPTLPQGAEASLPLTGSASCGVPGILRKMWTRHKKKSEYVGATNSAFEAD